MKCDEILQRIQDDELREAFSDKDTYKEFKNIFKSIFSRFADFDKVEELARRQKNLKQKKYIELRKMTGTKSQSLAGTPEYDGLCGMSVRKSRVNRKSYDDVYDDGDDYDNDTDYSRYPMEDEDEDNMYDGMCATKKRKTSARRKSTTRKTTSATKRGGVRKSTTKRATVRRRKASPESSAMLMADGVDGSCARRKRRSSGTRGRSSGSRMYDGLETTTTSSIPDAACRTMRRSSGSRRRRSPARMYDGLEATIPDASCASKRRRSSTRRSASRKSSTRRSSTRRSAMSSADAKKAFASNPRVNPMSGRRIASDGRAYRSLAVKLGVDPLNALSTRSRNMMNGTTGSRRKSTSRRSTKRSGASRKSSRRGARL